MPKWKKAMFILVLCSFIGVSVFFTFYAIARDAFEFEEQTDVGGIKGLNGWVFYGFNGNTSTKEISIDYVTDDKGENPDKSKPVVGIDEFTIVSDEYVEFINIGRHVQFIDEKAFYYCKQLKAITVDEANPYFCSVDGVLFSKDKTRLLLHPERNGEWLAEQAEGLAEEELAALGDTYVIPEGVERVAGWSFYKNDSLVHLTLPSTLREIGDMAFFGCGNLWSVWLPEGLKTIGQDAFSYCTSFSPVMFIPASVTDIGSNAFFSCTALTVFYMGAESGEDINLGESWLPKSIEKTIVKAAPEPIYGKTLAQAMAEKERIDAEKAAGEGQK